MSDSQDPNESAVIRHQVMQLMEADMDEFYLFLEERSGKSVSDKHLADLIRSISARTRTVQIGF
jgi:hypothetical protein